MLRTSLNVKEWQVLALMRNMANYSDLRCPGELVPDLAGDGTVPEWDSLGR
jgi:hypothetical protein